MIDWLLAVLLLVLLCFAFVVLYGAPYVPTLRKQIQTSLDILELSEGQTLLELGSGDGRVLLAAVKRGYTVIGYELNPILVLFSRWRLRKYNNARVLWGNYWTAKWPDVDAIFFFGIQNSMKKLDKKIVQDYGKPVKLVSFAFAIEDRKPVLSKDGVYLYLYK